VDDVELEPDRDGVPVVVALLVGPRALGERMGGWLGRWIANVARRLHPDADPATLRIAWERVDRVTSAVLLNVSRDLLPEPILESWTREHVIDHIPGADHAGA
jgi:hypothetical protein